MNPLSINEVEFTFIGLILVELRTDCFFFHKFRFYKTALVTKLPSSMSSGRLSKLQNLPLQKKTVASTRRLMANPPQYLTPSAAEPPQPTFTALKSRLLFLCAPKLLSSTPGPVLIELKIFWPAINLTIIIIPPTTIPMLDSMIIPI